MTKQIVDMPLVDETYSQDEAGMSLDGHPSKDIAIIGMACRFPGAANYQSYWDNLVAGIDSITEIPPDRWDWRDFQGDPRTQPNKSISKWGGFIEDADKFDAHFFGISPREAECMDPQQRMALELSWQCLEDAGYAPDALSGADVGVFMGACNFDYKTLQERFSPVIQGHMSTGNFSAVIANRVSYLFNFHGPSVVNDTACASSLLAIQQAVNALRAGECETALAGGVALLATPDRYVAFSKMGMLSPNGRCRTFDESADGYVRAEGAGIIYLKPLDAALRDGDQVLGVIKGVATNHCGRTRSITAPSALSQSQVISAALRQANVSPESITFVETHGTGTPVGDPIEIEGLTRAYQRADGQAMPVGRCALGAVKTNIGHLEGAAGIAGVIKVLLAMRHKQLPANLHFSQLNPRISLQGTPFYVLDALKPWTPLVDEHGRTQPLRASVNSFGFGGVNAHLIIEQAPACASLANVADVAAPQAGNVLALSARSEAALQRMAGQYAALIESNPSGMTALCRQTNAIRGHLPHRMTTVFDSTAELVAALKARAAAPLSYEGEVKPLAAKTVGFLFTGQGAQYIGMGRGLYASQAVFRQVFDECDALFKPYLKRSLAELVFEGEAGTLDQTLYTQPALFCIEYALAKLWAAYGVVPALAMGHSVGEIVAACIANVMTLADAVALVATRARLMQDNCLAGAMATVFASVDDVRAFIAQHRLPLDVAAVNAPQSTVISGLPAAVADAVRLFGQAGVDARLLQVERAFHSHLIEPIQRAFMDHLETTPFKDASLRVISNVTGHEMGEGDWSAEYWVNHARKPVLFMQGVQAMREAGVDLFIEIGPSPTLLKLAKRFMGDTATLVASLDPQTPDDRAFRSALAQVHAAGVDVRFDALYEGLLSTKQGLPPYPFVGQSYWISQGQVSALGHPLATAAATSLIGERLDIAGQAGIYFSRCHDLAESADAYLGDHRVNQQAILPGAAYACMAKAAVSQMNAAAADDEVTVSELKLLKALVLDAPRRVQTVLKVGPDRQSHVFEVWSRPACDAVQDDGNTDSDWVQHASGLVSWGGNPMPHGEGLPVIAANLDVQQFYAAWQQQAVAYGPSFQAIQQMELSSDQVWAEVALPAHLTGQAELAWHPALLDGIWQTVLPLLPDKVRRAGLIPLPTGLERLTVKGRMPTKVIVLARRARLPAEDGVHAFDLRIFGSSGEIIGYAEGLRLRPTKSLSRRTGDKPISDLRYFEPVWYRPALSDQAQIDVQVQTEAAGPGMDLVVYNEDSRHLAASLMAKLAPASLLAIGLNVDAPLTGSRSIASGDAEALTRALLPCKAVRTLYFLGAFHKGTPLRLADAFERLQDEGPVALFSVFKALDAQAAWRDGTVIKVIGNRVHAVHESAAVIPWGAGAFGVASVFCHENPHLKLANIDLALSNMAAEAEIDKAVSFILAESGDAQSLVALREGHRYLQRLEAVVLPPAASQAPTYRERGVYLIVGGAGGIGVTLSRHLASQYHARLVWVGRSELDAGKQALIDEIDALGGEATYCQADVRDGAALKQIVGDTLRRHGRLDGVIHSALSLQDQSVARMDLAQFKAGFGVKAEGSVALADAIDGVDVDFLAFFSSAVSFLGNRGQSNYVAGCVFQDAFACYLKQAFGRPVKVINWGRWGDVGAVAGEAYNERLDAQGLFAIMPDEGLDALEHVLAGPAMQLAVLRAEERLLAQMNADVHALSGWVPSHTAAVVDMGDRAAADVPDAPLPHPVSLQNAYTSLNRLACEIVQYSIHQLAGGRALPEDACADDLQAMLGIADAHGACFAAMLDMLRADDVSLSDGLAVPSLAHLEVEKDRMLSSMPWLGHEIRLLWACALQLPAILAGKVAATSVIFPDMSMALVEGVYRASPLPLASNRQVARQVAASLRAWHAREAGQTIRIVEIGAGTGGTTAGVLEEIDRLPPECRVGLEYVYTDISPAFLNRGKELFAEGRPYLRFELLDIEKPMASQHQRPGSADLVLASNVLHATRRLSRTLQNVKFLLKEGGQLVLNEVMRSQNFLTMTFGLLDGWWLAEDQDKRLPHSPLLSESLWRLAMADEGFEHVSCRIAGVAHEWCQGVIAGCSDGRYREERLAPMLASAQAARAGSGEGANQGAAHVVSADEVMASLGGAQASQTQQLLQDYLRGQLAEVLQLPYSQLDKAGQALPELFLSELGVDSLTAMDLRSRLRAQLNVNVPVDVLLGGTRIAAVIDLICDQLMVRRLMARQNTQAPSNDEGGTEDMESFTL